MEWKELLSSKRKIKNTSEEKEFERFDLEEIEKDYKKIVSSAAVRRLQDKTQVFPLDKSDFVRTRLTHSMEVSTIAKQLGTMVCKDLVSRNIVDLSNVEQMHIRDALMCAGLLHDLGNPPFGHFGEYAIGNWFKKNLSNYQYKGSNIAEVLNSHMKNDLYNFEGNAQALRILTKLSNKNVVAGMNLTTVVLNTLIKYPVNSLEFDKEDPDIKKHKLGYFLAEKDEFEYITTETGTKSADATFRHPLTFLLEAADDIAYATADLEDGYKKGMFTIEELIDFYNIEKENYNLSVSKKTSAMIDKLVELCNDCKSAEEKVSAFSQWIDYVRNWLMYVAVYRFVNNYDEIIEGKYQNDLFAGTFHEATIKVLKSVAVRFIFNDRDIMSLELAAQTIIESLLDKFVPAVINFEKGIKQSPSDKKIISLISANYVLAYQERMTDDDTYNLYLRLLLVTDYISGMTDSYAKELYQKLNGIY